MATVAAAALVFSLAPASAAKVKVRSAKRYEAAALIYHPPDEVPLVLAPDGTLDVGGVIFPGGTIARGVVRVWLRARDDVDPLASRAIYLSACQDVNKNGVCDRSEGDIRSEGCVNGGSRRLRLDGIKRKLPIAVFVRAVWGCDAGADSLIDSQSNATTGIVELLY
jgi:hypothetical protein